MRAASSTIGPRDVHQDRSWLHLREVVGAQRVAGALREHKEDPEDVRGRQEFVLRDFRHAELGASFLGQVLAPRDYFHVERLRDWDHRAAEVARAEEAECPSGEQDWESGLPAARG